MRRPFLSPQPHVTIITSAFRYQVRVVSEFRLFLSAVSSEFGQARDTLAASLRSRDMLIRVQSDFRQEAGSDTTLRKLHDYIQACSAVVCIIGQRSGALPPPAAAKPFAHMLPPGVAEASYTQWEFFFARHYKRRLSIYIATAAWKPDRDAPVDDRPDLQQALIRHIAGEQGLDRDYFDAIDRLGHLVLKEPWPQEPAPKPIDLHYPSIGPLFKGRETFLARLRASLTRPDGGTAAIAGRAVHGMGGVGKTRAAVEYAWAHRDDYTALILLDAETPDKLHTALAALVGPLRLPAARGARGSRAGRGRAGLAQRQSRLVPDPRQHRHRARPGRRPPPARPARRRPRGADQPPGDSFPAAWSGWTWTC